MTWRVLFLEALSFLFQFSCKKYAFLAIYYYFCHINNEKSEIMTMYPLYITHFTWHMSMMTTTRMMTLRG